MGDSHLTRQGRGVAVCPAFIPSLIDLGVYKGHPCVARLYYNNQVLEITRIRTTKSTVWLKAIVIPWSCGENFELFSLQLYLVYEHSTVVVQRLVYK